MGTIFLQSFVAFAYLRSALSKTTVHNREIACFSLRDGIVPDAHVYAFPHCSSNNAFLHHSYKLPVVNPSIIVLEIGRAHV